MIAWRGMRRAALTTAGVLAGGLVLGIGAGAAVDALLRPVSLVLAHGIAGAVALAVVTGAAVRWSQSIARLVEIAATRRAGITTALFVGVPVILTGAGLAALEPLAVQRGASFGLPIHAVYTVLFVTATWFVASLGSFGLGLGLRDYRVGLRLAVVAGPFAAAAFLLVAALMYVLGWRVGAPHAAQRATMLVVTALSLTAAALTAGAAIGNALSTIISPISAQSGGPAA